jgi:hypothetical protein
MSLTKNQTIFINTFINKLRIQLNNPKIPKTGKSIEDYHTDIYNIIDKIYTNPNSRKTHLNNLYVILKNRGLNPSILQQYIKEAMQNNEIAQQKKFEEEDAGEDEGCYLPFEELVKKFNIFQSLVNDNPKNLKNMMSYLILALNVYQPPLRISTYAMEIIRDYKDIKEGKNYLYINSKSDIMRYIIGHDKVSNKKTSLKDKHLDLSNEAIKIVNFTLQFFPRKYLIVNTRWGQISSDTYNNYLNYIFAGYQCHISQNILRSSYITNIINTRSKKELQKTARLMRSSVEMLSLVYDKGHKNNKTIIIPEKAEYITKLKSVVIPTRKLKYNIKDANNRYYKLHKKEIANNFKIRYTKDKYNILRCKILRNLKNKLINKPLPETIEKYDLKYDDFRNLWY